MNQISLLVRHRAKPGKRNQLKEIWETFVKPRVKDNPNHEYYFFSFDESDPDVVFAFQIFKDKKSLEEFMSGDWYPQYLDQVKQVVVGEPEISMGLPQFIKAPK